MLDFAAHAAPSPKNYGLARSRDGYFYGPTGKRVPMQEANGIGGNPGNCGSAFGPMGNIDWAAACGKMHQAQTKATAARQAAFCKGGFKGDTTFGFSC